MDRWGPAWCSRCSSCGTWASNLPIGINEEAHENLDEDRREAGLAELRRRNHGIVADRLREIGLAPGSTLLDVGSAHGWFVKEAQDRGISASGLEPDRAVAKRSVVDQVQVGFFPDALRAEERFDAISYNDVLEHMPDVASTLEESVRHLNDGGLLSINIPNSRGLFFRMAMVLWALGLHSPFERLWQVGLPSPHLWYFDREGLVRLAEKHGLELASSGTLHSVNREGLWQRAHSDRRPSALTALGVVLVWLAAPLFNASFASDIIHLVFRKPSA